MNFIRNLFCCSPDRSETNIDVPIVKTRTKKIDEGKAKVNDAAQPILKEQEPTPTVNRDLTDSKTSLLKNDPPVNKNSEKGEKGESELKIEKVGQQYENIIATEMPATKEQSPFEVKNPILEKSDKGSPSDVVVSHYKKGEQRTKDLIPTKKEPLAKGKSGQVFDLVNENKADRVLKKFNQEDPKEKKTKEALNELEISNQIGIHPNFVKFQGYYIKSYSNGTQKHKIEMEKIQGKSITSMRSEYQYLTAEETDKLLTQIKDCSSHLLDKGIGWRDVNDGNIFITEEKNLKICDYGNYKKIDEKKDCAIQLMLGQMEVVGWLIKASILKKKGIRHSDPDAQEKIEHAILFPKKFFGKEVEGPNQILSLYSFKGLVAIDDSNKEWTEFISSKLSELKSDDEIKAFLGSYIDAVRSEFQNALQELKTSKEKVE